MLLPAAGRNILRSGVRRQGGRSADSPVSFLQLFDSKTVPIVWWDSRHGSLFCMWKGRLNVGFREAVDLAGGVVKIIWYLIYAFLESSKKIICICSAFENVNCLIFELIQPRQHLRTLPLIVCTDKFLTFQTAEPPSHKSGKGSSHPTAPGNIQTHGIPWRYKTRSSCHRMPNCPSGRFSPG